MAIERIKRVNITEQAYDQLQKQLLRGNWNPGDKLPSENRLAAEMGVSRITVRQAIQKMAALGLLETKLGEGTFVRAYSPGTVMNGILPAFYLGGASLLEVIEFRKIIEIPTAELAAGKATDDDAVALESIFNRMVRVQGNNQEFYHADFDFHLKLADISGNSLVMQTNAILRDVLEIGMERIVGFRGNERGIYYHELLLNAIKARSPDRCRRIMSDHLIETYDSIRDILLKNEMKG